MKGVFNSVVCHNICHGDVHLRNICFKEDFNPTLKDFDFCVLKPNKKRDIQIFGKELQYAMSRISSLQSFNLVSLMKNYWPHQSSTEDQHIVYLKY